MANEQLDYNRLRVEVTILSCYLSARQHESSHSHPEDEDWRLFADLSTLLAIGNSTSKDARNVNAVLGTVTGDSIDYLVFVENA